jgi:acetylornithine deacetylase
MCVVENRRCFVNWKQNRGAIRGNPHFGGAVEKKLESRQSCCRDGRDCLWYGKFFRGIMADKELVSLLEEMIAIPSVSPEYADDPAAAGEARIASFLADRLGRLGFNIDLDEVAPGRPNLIASFGPDLPQKTLLFESHLDTVGVAGMSRPPFKAVHEGARLYARGACDDKGPMAAALAAVSRGLLDRLAAAGVRIVFAGAMGEETGNIGAARLAEKSARADQIVVLEPTELAIIHAHKGMIWLRVEVGGLAAHGSNPGRGVNAIAGMARVMQFLHERITKDRQARRDAVLGQPTLNIGMIHGGYAVNIVPDSCSIEVDRRTLPGEDEAEIIERIRGGLADIQEQGGIASHAVRVIKLGRPFQTSENCGLVAALKEGFERAGREARMEGAAWYSDAGVLSRVAPEIVVFGPGSIKQAHTADEYIDCNDLQAGCDILRSFLECVAENSWKEEA